MFPNGNIGMKRMDILITFQAFRKDWMAFLKYFKHHETTSTFATYYFVRFHPFRFILLLLCYAYIVFRFCNS